MRIVGLLAVLLAGGLMPGCGPAATRLSPAQVRQVEQRALEALKRGAAYKQSALVRAQAIESLQQEAAAAGLPWIRQGLGDEHPAVRFAACMAVGTLGDEASRQSVTKLVDDEDDSVRAAAIFALHRLGDSRYTAELAMLLKHNEDPAVRRNAALVLGRLQEPGAVPLLAGVMNDEDQALHAQALESMALLGSEQARQQLTFVANSGNGPEEVFALNALSATGDAQFTGAFLYKLENGEYLETRLAAARGLGEVGAQKGIKEALKIALDGLGFDKPQPDIEHDPPENQIMRARQMAAIALGALGDPTALGPLAERIEDNSDPRVQVAAAKAALQIINRQERQSLPF